ncbi:MAG: hypothetical protein Q8M94_19990, partial [Ignavibacteria bacterium]|nr:hypothetical protein [Ignavibacteria bacterium]
EDWKAEITIEVSKIENWFSIDKGREFVLPKGEKQIPIIVRVDVPKNADFGRYKGQIRVRTSSLAPPEAGTVSIALGGYIDVDLNVVEKKIFDFKIRGIKVDDLEEGHKTWFLYFPGKIKFSMQIENIGNIKAAPTKVYFDIYDEFEKEILESTEATKIEKAEPFEIRWVVAKLPTKLKAGSYWARFKIYKNEEVVNEDRIHLSILPKGTIAGYKGAGLLDLSLKEKIFIVFLGLVGLAVLGGIGYGGYRIWKKKKEIKT